MEKELIIVEKIESFDWKKVLESQGLFKYHEFVVQGMRITDDGKILSCEIMKEVKKEDG